MSSLFIVTVEFAYARDAEASSRSSLSRHNSFTSQFLHRADHNHSPPASVSGLLVCLLTAPAAADDVTRMDRRPLPLGVPIPISNHPLEGLPSGFEIRLDLQPFYDIRVMPFAQNGISFVALFANSATPLKRSNLSNGWFLNRHAQQIAGVPLTCFVTALYTETNSISP